MADPAGDSAFPIEADTRNLGWVLKQQEKTSDHGRKKDNCKEGQSLKEGS